MKRANLITREGWHKLDDELKFLWNKHRPEVTKAVSEAAALGDRSENAEYKEGKRQLRSIDRRIRFLTKRLDELQIIDYSPVQEGTVYFGAYVELERTTLEDKIPDDDAPIYEDLDKETIAFFESIKTADHITTQKADQTKIGETVHYRIVGSDELEADGFQISINAPMARALIGKQVDDEVYVYTPSGGQCWFVNKIQYKPFE